MISSHFAARENQRHVLAREREREIIVRIDADFRGVTGRTGSIYTRSS